MHEIFSVLQLLGEDRIKMFGFTVKTMQNGFGSPQSPSTVARVESSSPKTDVGEIDKRAPFESVKAAVNLFGKVISPKARPITKKTKAEEQKLLERETQHHMVIKELEFYREQLRSAENDKAQAKQDLHKANLALHDLTGKLENLSESKQAAIKATEAMKRRAAELEVQQTEAPKWKLELDLERERYKDSSGELIVAKQELANLRQDFNAALGAKLTAKEVAEMAIKALREVYLPEENLGRKIEEATEAIKLLREQLNDQGAAAAPC
ncbi:hypothetical protein SASPL_152723 [Salvia splendens]|uniref:Uncharacterized protein n=1 Tax=Salvia splendens TaxID=180675 RepID=A0A8X8W3T2_SALSN|nr:hypothetical protein SASPL_152723 [Salvia splendens]